MRKVTTALSALSLLAFVAGCEDGPKQTYEPAPADFAGNGNDRPSPPSIDSAAKTSFAPPDGGASSVTNAEIICSTPVKKDKIAVALRQPVIPPRFACGIDVAGGDSYQGIKIEDVERGFKRVDFLVDGRYPKPIDTKQALANTTVTTAASLYKGNNPNDPSDFTQLCQGDNLGDFLGSNGAENTVGWGDNQECFANYSVRTHKIASVWQSPGYLGAMTCYSRPNGRFEQDGAHVYTVPMNSRVLKDGMPLDFASNWSTDKNSPTSFLNEMYDACLFTFASFFTPEDGVVADPGGGFNTPLGSAAANGHLVLGQFSDGSNYWYVPAIGFGWLVSSITAGPEVATTPTNFQLYNTKTLGFSTADITLKFDAEGPVGLKPVIGVSPLPCRITIGMTYGDFVNTCVAVTGDDTKNKAEINKLLGNKTNARERYFLDVQGIDVSFTETALPQFDIIHDSDSPSQDDVATDIVWDQSALGKIANDYVGNDPNAKPDYHGGGLVWLEFARLAQAEIQKLRADVCADPKKCMPTEAPLRTIGDPACLGDNVKSDMKGGFTYPQGCTGFEGFVTTAPPLDPASLPPLEPYLNNSALGVAAAGLGGGGLKVGLKPGQPKIVICNKVGGNACTVSTGGFSGPLFGGSYSRLLKVFGHGNVGSLPNDIKDGRFFFKQWFRALNKYLIAAGAGTETANAVHAIKLDPDALFFDGSGQFESAEYVDRRFVEQTGRPFDVNVTADTKNGILNDYNFSRTTYRGEELVYDAMLDRSTPGSVFEGKGDDILLSNVFGSPVLARVWGAKPQCATAGGQACVGAKVPSDPTGAPVKGEDGKPILTAYAGAIQSSSPFALGFRSVACTKSDPMTGMCTAGVNCCPLQPSTGMEASVTTQVGTELTIEPTESPQLSAKVTYPVRQNPYDNSSYYAPVDLGADPTKTDGSHIFKMAPAYDATNGTKVSLVPYLKKQPGVGFAIPVSGTLNKFITTAALDLSGTTITFNIDVDDDPTPDPITKKPVKGAIVIKAVETQDFLGLVFLCRDPDTAEVLSVRMYDTAASILDWINHHPAAATACDFIVQYSPYNNFPDFVISRQNGVTLGINLGGGFGRVNDVTLWDPNTPY